MYRIVAPLQPEFEGPEVVNLQDGLRRLVTKLVIEMGDDERDELLRSLADESEGRVYKDATQRSVQRFQEQRGLDPHGAVDEETAGLLNEALSAIGGLDEGGDGHWGEVVAELQQQSRRLEAIDADTDYLSQIDTGLKGVKDGTAHLTAIDQNIASLASERTFLSLGARSEAVKDVQKNLVKVGLWVPQKEMESGTFGTGTRTALLQLQEQYNLARTGVLDDASRNALDIAVGIATSSHRIEGRIVLDNGVPAKNLKFRIVNKGFGDKETELGVVQTDEEGFYALPYQPNGRIANLEIKTLDGKTRLAARTTALGAQEVIDIVASRDVQPPPAEYRRLVKEIGDHVGAIANLAQAREDATRQDLSVLHRATQWDARLIALAATTERLHADADIELSQEALYGLLRTGLPSDKLSLARVGSDVVGRALKKAQDANVIGLTDHEITQVTQQYATFSDKVRLTIPAPGTTSTYGDLLQASGLPAEAQKNFARAYLSLDGDASQLWQRARNEGVSDPQVRTLQMQGKLSFLAGNSAAVTSQLMGKNVNDPSELVEQGFADAEKWKTEVKGIAGNEPAMLAALIPSSYVGATVEDRLDAYASDMARKLRISYPTQVIAQEIKTSGQDSFHLGTAAADTATVLANAAQQGFRLGGTPVSTFFGMHEGVGAGMSKEAFEGAKLAVRKLHSVYQITPDDEAMKTLLEIGLNSAYDVVAVSEDVFIELYGKRFKPPEKARQVYRKAKQVTSVTYNVFGIASTLESTPAMHAVSAPPEVRKSARNELIKHFPTMETLFGSMDYCDCEHCRSVFSPAAYLVDLLQFIDPEPEVWNTFLARWKVSHNTDYDPPYKRPYEALIERRPDLPHILLTCENTNTVLPYIDVVNEILEYYVAHKKLDEDAAQNTGEATKEELLAEPQYVDRNAYSIVREARYPLTLPFDLPLETVRQFCAYFEVPFAELLESFRVTNKLFAPTQPFDRAHLFAESLGISPAEWAIFADPDPITNDRWFELYGYPTGQWAIQAPTNKEHATLSIDDEDAKALRVGDSYTYFDVDADKLYTQAKEISEIGAPGSGGGTRTKVTFEGIWTAPPVAGDRLSVAPLVTLSSAKALSRQLGVTYQQLLEIVTTGFVNPELARLTVVYRLGVSIGDLMVARDPQNVALHAANKDLLGKSRDSLTKPNQTRFDALKQDQWDKIKTVDAFAKRLAKFVASSGMKPAEIEAALAAIPFKDILVLADPDAGCDFELTTFRYASGDAADPIAFLRVNLFVRLWRKLGWSIAETDRALQAFVPRAAPYTVANLPKRPLETALIYVAHLKTLVEKLNVKATTRPTLATLWADMETRGKNPLYAQRFLTHGVLANDDIFDHPLGDYLSAKWISDRSKSRWHRVREENVESGDAIDPAPFAADDTVELRYNDVEKVQYLAYKGVLTNARKNALAALSPSPVLPRLLDAVQEEAKAYTLLRGHLLALQGALDLSADEIRDILKDADLSIETADLSIPNVSLLYRYGLLAKALKLTVREMVSLKQLSGIDPFTALEPDTIDTIEKDYPFSKTLAFAKIVETIKDGELSIDDLDFLLRHKYDPVGPLRPDEETILQLLSSLSRGVRAIREEHAIPEDAGTLSDDVLRQKLGLVLPADVAERFIGMLNGTAEFTASKSGVAAANVLDASTFSSEPLIRHVNYQKEPQKEQRLTWRGVLFDGKKASLEATFGPALKLAQKQVFADLLGGIQASAHTFFDAFLAKPAVPDPAATGFLDAKDYRLLFDPELPLAANETEQQRASQRRETIARAFLPFLQERLIRQFIVQTVTTGVEGDPGLTESLLTDTRLLGLNQPVGAAQPLLKVLAGTDARGVTASFFASTDGSGIAAKSEPLLEADTSLAAKPAGAKSAKFEGYLEVPTPGAYRFLVTLGKKDTQVVLRFSHLSEPTLNATAAADGDTFGSGGDEYVELQSGIPYHFTVSLNTLSGDARVLVQGVTLPKGGLSQLTLYPFTAMDDARRALLLLTKVNRLVQALHLTEREVRYILTHSADFSGIDLKALPTRTSDDSLAGTKTLFTQFLRLAAYARLKQALAGGTDDLISVFEANAAADPATVKEIIARLTRRTKDAVGATATILFGETPVFANEEPLGRLWEALKVIERIGVPVTAIANWTRIINSGLTEDERFEIARGLKESVKARFDPETWLRVAQPIFDKLRPRQRDALVAYIVHRHGFERLEQLYEYFLIDPGMEPVVQTSRIRLAIGTVQLFIQRCLLNLEARVHPSAIINARQWEWMKRYRVWEANRKIFLYPENWLEPEFRDDKTHLFTELEGTLFQDDVSSDLVEDAFLTYLRKLEVLARLDIVAMHLEAKDDPANNTLHVFGRTFSLPHAYFYRRYAHGMWTPWEPVNANIEGDHLAPVVWRDRLCLFWVTFMTKAVPPSAPFTVDLGVTVPALTLQLEAQLHWSEYVRGEWSARESSEHEPPDAARITGPWVDPRSIFIHVTKDPPTFEGDPKPLTGQDRGVTIHLGSRDVAGTKFQQAFYLAGRNSTPEKGTYGEPPKNVYGANTPLATRYVGDDRFTATYTERIITGPGASSKPESHTILDEKRKHLLLPCDNAVPLAPPAAASLVALNQDAVAKAIASGLGELSALVMPVFYQDNENTLFVEPTATERTIEDWQEWVTRAREPEPEWKKPDWWDKEKYWVVPEFPYKVPFPEPDGDPWRGVLGQESQDWLINPGTGLMFDGQVIGPKGMAGLAILPSGPAEDAIANGGTVVNVHAGSGIAAGNVVIQTDVTRAGAGLIAMGGGLNIVGDTGFNAGLKQNFGAFARGNGGLGMQAGR
jgi:peptidoglycan hydrolase-like protein with peptidoglycan-binding domain